MAVFVSSLCQVTDLCLNQKADLTLSFTVLYLPQRHQKITDIHSIVYFLSTR